MGLEQKLIELGYRISIFDHRYIKYNKETDNYILIQLSESNNSIIFYSFGYQNAFKTQQDIDNLQQAFNEMQKDLEILKECEE